MCLVKSWVHIKKFMVWLCRVKFGPVGDAWNVVSLKKLHTLLYIECMGSNILSSFSHENVSKILMF